MQNILACIDESTWSTSVQDAAIWAAKQLNSPLLFLHSIEKKPLTETTDLSGAIGFGARSKLLKEIAALDQERAKVSLQLGKELLTKAKDNALEAGCEQVEAVQRHGQFIDTVLAYQSDARLVVMGHSGSETGEKTSLLGSHVESLLRQISTPVLITSHEFKAPRRFMLAYDGRATTELALERIIQSEFLLDLDCHLVTVKAKHAGQQEKFEQAVKRLTEAGYSVTAQHLEGPIFQQLFEYQEKHHIEMLIMGAFSGTQLRQFFVGSNTLKMLAHSQVPVLVMK